MRYAVLALVTVLISAMALPADSGGEAPWVAHEWGTFTSVSGADGVPISWRPLSGPTDLPGFVYTGFGKGTLDRDLPPRLDKLHAVAPIRMETPVLYFYSPRDLDVDVRVQFPEGQVTEWYPRARSLTDGIDWGRIQVRPGATPTFLREKEDSHYYPARETDASPVHVATGGVTQDEKFLFYRGVGWFKLPVQVTLDGDQVRLKNTGSDPIPQAILFEHRGSLAGFRMIGPVGGESRVPRPELSSKPGDLVQRLEAALVEAGLFPKEAQAMIRTWNDSWFEEGLRVLYVMPRKAVDAALPLVLRPRPDAVSRVFVGRAELISPEIEREALEIVTRNAADLPAASSALRKFGRFAQPILFRAVKLTTDPALQEKIQKLAWSLPKQP